jgi:hypothetical protein
MGIPSCTRCSATVLHMLRLRSEGAVDTADLEYQVAATVPNARGIPGTRATPRMCDTCHIKVSCRPLLSSCFLSRVAATCLAEHGCAQVLRRGTYLRGHTSGPKLPTKMRKSLGGKKSILSSIHVSPPAARRTPCFGFFFLEPSFFSAKISSRIEAGLKRAGLNGCADVEAPCWLVV